MSKSGILSGNQPYLFDTKNLFFRCQVIFVFYYLIVLPLFLFGVRFSLEVSLFFLLFLLFMLLLPLSCAFHFTPYSFYRRHVISCFGFNKVYSALLYATLLYVTLVHATLLQLYNWCLKDHYACVSSGRTRVLKGKVMK